MLWQSIADPPPTEKKLLFRFAEVGKHHQPIITIGFIRADKYFVYTGGGLLIWPHTPTHWMMITPPDIEATAENEQ